MRTRLGVAGLGWLGESLIKDVPRIGGLEVIAVQDVVASRASDVAQQYGVTWSGEAFEQMLKLERLDAVLICTPNAFHAAQAQQALAAGKHVLVQKPLALSLGDADATIAAAAAAQRMLFVDYSYRFLATVAALREHLPRPVTSVRAAFHNIYGPGAEKAWFFDPRLSGGGALTDLGVHMLDLALWLLEPTNVELEAAQLSGDGPVESAAHVRLRLDATPCILDVSWNASRPLTEIVFEVTSGERRVRWENVEGSFFRFRTVVDDRVIVDRETTLREDTLAAFKVALQAGSAPAIDTRVYALLDQAYARTAPAR